MTDSRDPFDAQLGRALAARAEAWPAQPLAARVLKAGRAARHRAWRKRQQQTLAALTVLAVMTVIGMIDWGVGRVAGMRTTDVVASWLGGEASSTDSGQTAVDDFGQAAFMVMAAAAGLALYVLDGQGPSWSLRARTAGA